MNTVGLTYITLVTIAYWICFRLNPPKARQSLRIAGRSLWKMLPTFVAIFGLVGLFQTFLPPALIERELGSGSPGVSLLSGGLLGSVSIGPAAAAFPLAGSLLQAGAWPPAIAAFIVSWVLVGVVTLPFEASIFGSRYAVLRNGISFVAALLIGWLMGSLL